MNPKWFVFCCASTVLLSCATIVLASGPKISEMITVTGKANKHNLSAQNTGAPYYALDNGPNSKGQQICIFCHTPHNSSSQGPLWNRTDTTQTFGRYTSSTLQIRSLTVAQYDGTKNAQGETRGEPNGSSRLCLSCHDGVTPLGGLAILGGPGGIINNGPITMLGGDVIATGTGNYASFRPDTNKMKVGHHPVSFVYATSFDYKNQTGTMIGLQPTFGPFRLPNAVSMQGSVKLQDSKRDGNGWMQCTTCHDAHQNIGNDVETYPSTSRKITPFWVYSGSTAVTSHDTVCTSCHTSLGSPYNKGVGGVNPWPLP